MWGGLNLIYSPLPKNILYHCAWPDKILRERESLFHSDGEWLHVGLKTVQSHQRLLVHTSNGDWGLY